MLGHPVDLVSAGAGAPAPAADPVVTGYTAVLAEVLQVDSVDPDAHVFDDLGADSMVMARFCARVRKRTDLPAVSIKDVYAHPTLRGLAGALAPAPAPAADPVTSGLAEVLAEVLQVDTVDPDAHVFDDLGADSMVMARFCARVRKRTDLPAVSIKDVYAHPTLRGLAGALAPAPAPAASPVQDGLAAVLGGVLGVESVDPDAHVFDDLGADSMVMARFCARVRKDPGLPPVSIKEVYAHPTLRALAAAVSEPVAAVAEPAAAASEPAAPSRTVRRATSVEYVLCGLLQALFFVGYCVLAATIMVTGYDWISDGAGVVDLYARSVVVGAASFVGLTTLPILAKWVLIGRGRPQQFPVWSLAYVRFWIVKTMVQWNPLLLFFNGTPLYVVYLRALGAKVGRDVAVFVRQVPVCTGLLTIGDGTVIRKDVLLSGYRAHDGLIQTGRITLGRNVVVGEASVIDIETSMGDGAQLGHRSSLEAGQAVPAGESWHGTPARRADVDYGLVPPMHVSSRRKVVYTALKLFTVLLLEIPLALGAVALLFQLFPGLAALLEAGPFALTSMTFYLDALVGSLVLYFGAYLVGFLFVTTVPRVLSRLLTPGRVYPLYGFHYSVQRTITRTTNAKPLLRLTGNSSYVVHYLKGLGYHLGRVVQTGSNFGEAVKHDNPYLTSVGSGTMVADGLSIMNADFSSTSFTVSRASIGERSFLGNAVAYPAEAKVGNDVLLATKVMVPIHGEVREGVGLLGSPAFEIPRTVSRDATIDAHLQAPGELARRLAAKNRHNLVTMGLFLLTHWVSFFAATLITTAALDLSDSYGGALPLGAAMVLDVLFITFFGVLIERIATGFRPLTPQQCSIYDPYFWWHERYWKVMAETQPKLYNGTPFKPVLWRLLGVRIGRRVFDDGAIIPERTLATIGDGCTLNAGSHIQAHSQEDGGFKSDHITIGAGVTLGVSSWVHYGVTMGDGSALSPDAFLMKGSEVPPGEHWGGNPAVELNPFPVALPAPDPVPHPRDATTRTDDADRIDDPSSSVEERMALLQGDGAPSPSSTVPLPRKSGRHRATQRHLAGSR